jgi:1,4-alpha-glucan branching enzyme
MDKEMYFHMHADDTNPVIDRGISLHKMIRLFTMALGGQAYLNFMGNEFGHPEWIDFPRSGNDWSYKYARRQWSLVDNDELKYKFLSRFDKAMIRLAREFNLMQSSTYANLLNADEDNKCIMFYRSGLVFLFNFSVSSSLPDYEFSVPEAGNYKVILNSDDAYFGGHNRIDDSIEYPSFSPHNDHNHRLRIYFTNRTVLVLKKQN